MISIAFFYTLGLTSIVTLQLAYIADFIHLDRNVEWWYTYYSFFPQWQRVLFLLRYKMANTLLRVQNKTAKAERE